MRNFLLICVGLLIAYWADQTFCNGLYSREVTGMLREISTGYK
jgi:hypothetical protein